jgi:hypothetical protein
MKYFLATAAFLILGLSQLLSQNHTKQVETIYKENGSYYTFIEPIQKTKLWYRLFIQFDSSKVINKGHVNMASGENFYRGRKWQILSDTLYFLLEAQTDNFFNSFMGLYNFYAMDTVFKIKATGEGKFNYGRKYNLKLLGSFKNHIGEAHYTLYSWYDYIHTKEDFTMFSSINDTILIVKDIIEHQEWPKVVEREHRYTFPHLGKFNVFKINDGDFVLNDIGDFYHLQDSVPRKVGHLEFQTVKQVFYLKDNDTGTLSFNCRFVPLFPEYDKLIGYIGPEHWLYTRYFAIKEEYMEELHELNRKTWR